MIKLPARQDGVWTVQYSNHKMPDIVATRNLDFDEGGILRLAKPTISYYSSADDADFGAPIGYFTVFEGAYFVLTEKTSFFLDMAGVISETYKDNEMTVAQDGLTNVPSNTGNNRPDMLFFNDDIVFSNPTDRKMYLNSGGSFTNDWEIKDTSASLNASVSLPMCLFASRNTLAVGNDENVDQFSTAYAAGTQLVLPTDLVVTGIAYNNGYVGITTHHSDNTQRCYFYVWDGATAAANYTAEVPASTCYSPVGYRGSFVFMDGNGVLQHWTPTGLQPLAVFPVYETSSTFVLGQSNNNQNHSIIVDGELLYINVRSSIRTGNDNGKHFVESMPGGVWCYDPSVGLYHKYAPSGTKVYLETIATASVTVATDSITVTAAQDTGTPVIYLSGTGDTAIGGLVDGNVYYTIKVDATTVQLASSYANALVGTKIDLTGTGNNNQKFHWIKKSNFGQSYISGQQGCVFLATTRASYERMYYHDMFYGSKCAQLTNTEVNVGGFSMRYTENRGHFITARFQSAQLQDDWQKIFVKHSKLLTALDKIVVKYTTLTRPEVTYMRDATTDGIITWVDADTFTTTDTQWASVLAGDEVEVIQGAGSGYLFHVSSITVNAGTYTVNLDESVKNVSTSAVGRAIVSRWKKLTTLSSGTITNEDGYSEIAVGVKSKSIQFKIELRGEDVEIEEILIAHQLHKPVA